MNTNILLLVSCLFKQLDHHEQQDFIANFLRAIRFDPESKLVIVEASMGGSVGNPFVVMHPELVRERKLSTCVGCPRKLVEIMPVKRIAEL